MVFVLCGQQWNTPWLFVAHSTYAVFQDITTIIFVDFNKDLDSVDRRAIQTVL